MNASTTYRSSDSILAPLTRVGVSADIDGWPLMILIHALSSVSSYWWVSQIKPFALPIAFLCRIGWSVGSIDLVLYGKIANLQPMIVGAGCVQCNWVLHLWNIEIHPWTTINVNRYNHDYTSLFTICMRSACGHSVVTCPSMRTSSSSLKSFIITAIKEWLLYPGKLAKL